MADFNHSPGSLPEKVQLQSPAAPLEAPTMPAPATSQAPAEHLNIKVTDGNNEVFFKIKKSTKLEKLMHAFCDRQGKQMTAVRFLFDGQKVNSYDSPDTLEMVDGDSLEVHQEQIGGQ